MSSKLLAALAAKGAALRGLHCFGCASPVADADWANLLRACPSLLWLGLDRPCHFERRAWEAIPPSVSVHHFPDIWRAFSEEPAMLL